MRTTADVMSPDFAAMVDHLKLPTDAPVYVYCASGGRSKMAAGLLRRRGIEGAVNAGGYGALVRAGAEDAGVTALLSVLETTQVSAALVGLGAACSCWKARIRSSSCSASGRSAGATACENLVLGAVNSAVVAVVFAGLWVAAAEVGAARGWGLLRLVDLPPAAHAVLAVLLLDVWTYAWHRMNHRVPFLWRFHRVHHSDAQMDVTTASRFHTGEIVLSSALRIPLVLALGVTGVGT